MDIKREKMEIKKQKLEVEKQSKEHDFQLAKEKLQLEQMRIEFQREKAKSSYSGDNSGLDTSWMTSGSYDASIGSVSSEYDFTGPSGVET